MKLPPSLAVVLLAIRVTTDAIAEDLPYLTTQSPLTLVSSNDGEFAQTFLKKPDGTTDWELKTKDSFTVIHLGPDHPPIIKTVYDTVPATIYGTPTMAMSNDGRFVVIANHDWRPDTMSELQLPTSPQTNSELTAAMLQKHNLTAQRSNLLSLIDLSKPDYPVAHRVLLDDQPIHILAHPDGKRYVVGATKRFYIYRIVNGKLMEVSRSPHNHGLPCFWLHPRGDRLIATQGTPLSGEPATVQWYSIENDKVRYLHEIKVKPGLSTELLETSYILRVSRDGNQALICQRSIGNGTDFCDILIADLTLKKPMITNVVKQVADGVESFAFHPNGKMAVATGLSRDHNCIAVLDIKSSPARLLYTLDAKGIGQGIEFTPEGDKLFVGSAIAGRIEVFDVTGDFELRKNPKFLNVGFGHNSLTIGPRYQPLNSDNK